jgi:hypothetical protein
LLGKWLKTREVEGAVDQGDVSEGLRKITNQPGAARIVFLAEQPNVVAQLEQPIEQPTRVLPAVL